VIYRFEGNLMKEIDIDRIAVTKRMNENRRELVSQIN
jgi:hypothetical protein